MVKFHFGVWQEERCNEKGWNYGSFISGNTSYYARSSCKKSASIWVLCLLWRYYVVPGRHTGLDAEILHWGVRAIVQMLLFWNLNKYERWLGHLQANRRDLCGQRFGKLTVIRRVEGTQSNRARADSWLCRCDCGNESVVLGSNLVRGHTKSCGCIKLNDLTGQHIGSLTVLGRSD